MQKIFVIEDDENIRNLVKIALEGYGYNVHTFEAAEPAIACIELERPDLAVFDLMLPGMDGLEAIRKIRNKELVKETPVIILTAKDKEYDKVVGLDGGADDYITKPFGVLELAARIRSLLRRSMEPNMDSNVEWQEYAHLSLNLQTREVYVDKELVLLTYKEYELLVYLIQHKSRVVTREELLDRLWDYNSDIETRTLDIHIGTLRQKLGEEVSSYIKTMRSVGYRFIIIDGGSL
ncbi:MAG TPA: response regulator transcription factor [Lachnospiraceae bacterium]|nr:response regulator transcription factor [Lachnospiraceae bacterium]